MRNMAIFLIVAMVLSCGCTRDIDKVTQAVDLPPVPATVTNVVLQIGDGRLELSWQVPDPGGIDLHLIYRSDSNALGFRLYDSTETGYYPDLAVRNNVRYFYQISSVSGAGIEGPRSVAVSGVPGLFSIRIEGDDVYTNKRNVSVLAEYPSGTSHIMLSNSADFTGSKWRSAAQSVSWELPDRDGGHTVYALFRTADGNESADPVSDDIILDRTALIESLTADDGGSILTAGDVVHFRMVTGEPGGSAAINFPKVGNLELFDNGTAGDVTAGDGIYERDYAIPPDVEFENGVVTGEFRDAAGNSAPRFTIDHTLTIRNEPLPVSLYPSAVFEDRVELAWTESIDGDFASYRIYRSETVPVSDGSRLIARLTSRGQLSAADTSVVPSSTYFYVVIVTDQSGLTAHSNTISVTSLDNTAPSPVVLVHEKTDSTAFRLTWTRNRDSDFESYRVFRSRSSIVSLDAQNLYAIVNSQSTTSFSGDDEGKEYYYMIAVYDKFGLPSVPSNVVPYAGP